MATITLTIGALTNAKTISAGDVTRLLDAAKFNYGQVDDGNGGLRDRTNQELFDIFAQSFYSSLVTYVKDAETRKAAVAVVDVSIS